MSVYTAVSSEDLMLYLSDYEVGELRSFDGISEGIENTNYFVNTSRGKYVLTLFENLDHIQIAQYLDLTAYLNEHGIRCAHPIADKYGRYLKSLNNKPSALVERLQGRWLTEVRQSHVTLIGRELGKMHNAISHYQGNIENRRDAQWRLMTAEKIMPLLDQEDRELLQNEIKNQVDYLNLKLPCGIVHGDLFRDNVLFNGNTLSGLIDFYFAGRDYFLFDLAVVANDWCLDNKGQFCEPTSQTLITAYSSQRQLTQQERQAWPLVLRAAALRFWLSRLEDIHSPRVGELTFCKDPDEFKQILRNHRGR